MSDQEILDDIVLLTDSERERLFDELKQRWCIHCGVELDGRKCQCQNDE